MCRWPIDPTNRKVKYGPFSDDTARTLTYQVTPPSTVSGTATFTGLASLGGSGLLRTVIIKPAITDRAAKGEFANKSRELIAFVLRAYLKPRPVGAPGLQLKVEPVVSFRPRALTWRLRRTCRRQLGPWLVPERRRDFDWITCLLDQAVIPGACRRLRQRVLVSHYYRCARYWLPYWRHQACSGLQTVIGGNRRPG